jgi:CheY-like chemotaxis protein
LNQTDLLHRANGRRAPHAQYHVAPLADLEAGQRDWCSWNPHLQPAPFAEDDHARASAAERLNKLWPELELVASVGDGNDAVCALDQHKPNILFLDIQMPGLNGLDVAHYESNRCHVVFITAYDEYAVAAFDQGAVDYVLKPFNAARLAVAVGRSGRNSQRRQQTERLLLPCPASRIREAICVGSMPRSARPSSSLPSRRSAISRPTTSTPVSSRRTRSR